MRILTSLLVLFFSSWANASCVILLHGLARTDASMKAMESALTDAGFYTVNVDHPSREHPVEELAQIAIEPALESCADDAINFVTHSLGGILVRQYLSEHEIPNLNRVVMLGPPNQGTEVVDKLAGIPGFLFINGEAGLQMGTGNLSIPNNLGAADFDAGIIAGTRSINLILSLLIPGTDDGKVAVERTKLEGMADHLEMPVTHAFMMKNKEVIAQVIHYLEHGSFKREQT